MVYMIIKNVDGVRERCWQAYSLHDFRVMVAHVREKGTPELFEIWEISRPGTSAQRKTVYRITDEKYNMKGLTE